ncbi:MAG: glucoamylase family protein [Paludibacter sp.]|nr:glucoamylase family protein [Paludibacter sp.]
MKNKFLIHSIIVACLLIFTFSNCNALKNASKYVYKGKIDYNLSKSDELMLDSIQRKTFEYFLHENNPEIGIIKDRAAKGAFASIAATGFGLPTYAIAAERKWITRNEAVDRTLKILKFFATSENNSRRSYKGFYYHFLDIDEGNRVDSWVELSSIDTGILMMGVIFARNYYNKNNQAEKEIREYAGILLSSMDWTVFNMDANSKQPYTISMAWHPEKGTTNWGWHGYTEGLFLYVLAAGTGIDNPIQHYNAWLKGYEWKTPYPGLSHVAFPPLFGHQFSEIFIDFRGLADKYLKEKGISYFENSRRATLAQQQYAIENPKGWVGYDSLTWGFTATDGPGPNYNSGDKKFEGYAGRGATGKDDVVAEDGTIGIYGSICSLPFTPDLSLKTIKNIQSKMGSKLWGKYGFYDSFNQTANWVDNDFVGIDQGPTILMIENFRSGLIWKYMMKDPIIQKGLQRLNFEYIKK